MRSSHKQILEDLAVDLTEKWWRAYYSKGIIPRTLQIFQKRLLLDLTRAQSSNNKVIKHLHCFFFEINENESALIMVSKLNPLFCTVVDTNWSLKERCTTDDMSIVSAKVPAILLLLIEYVGKYENKLYIYKYNWKDQISYFLAILPNVETITRWQFHNRPYAKREVFRYFSEHSSW